MGAIENVFITGELPFLMSDLVPCYNIGSYLTQWPTFENAWGFTQSEVDQLLDDVYSDYSVDPLMDKEVRSFIASHYKGYHFVSHDSEALYNPADLMYFLNELIRSGTMPKLAFEHLQTNLSCLDRFFDQDKTQALLNQLQRHNKVGYDQSLLWGNFKSDGLFEANHLPVWCYYLGILTKQDHFHLGWPNLNMQQAASIMRSSLACAG